MRSILLCLGTISALAAAIGPACAQEVQTNVPATAMPWIPAANRKMDFGRHDGTRPVMIAGYRLREGSAITFAASGETTTAKGGMQFGPDGQSDYVTNDNGGNSGTFFPSRYIDRASYPVRLNALIGAFVDADGQVVGKPFVIGAGTKARIPAGALAISLGVNDDIFSDNDGTLSVTIDIPQAIVTVEEAEKP